jgi:sec-independent protein translocase protein TatB
MVIVPQIEAANIGMADSLVLMVMALVVFGPRRLPQIGRQIGKLMYEFRKASNDFKYQMEEEMRNAEEADRRKQEEARLAAMAVPGAVKEEKPEPDVTPQVLDPGDGAPSYYESALKDSNPYPYGGDVPPAEASGTATAAGEETTSPEKTNPETTSVETTTPRIQPPETGAPVAYRGSAELGSGETSVAEMSSAGTEAARETGATTSAEAATPAVSETASAEETGTATEQAAHHG